MVDDVVVGQRLLDQEQVEVVECLKRGQVVERVRRVGVDLERDRGISLAHLPDHVDIPARGDLQLDPAVAFLEVSIDLVEQVLDPPLDPQADPREDLGPRAAEQRHAAGFPARGPGASQQAISSPAWANRFPFTSR